MYAALGCGGMLDGVRLLSRETLAHTTEVQASTASGGVVLACANARGRGAPADLTVWPALPGEPFALTA
jgi:hypothetical protein